MARPAPKAPASFDHRLHEYPSSMPAPLGSETRMRAAVVGSDLQLVAVRFRTGDYHGALLAAMQVLDESPVPILCASATYLAKAPLTNAGRLLTALVDGTSTLEEVIEASGIGLLEGIDAMCELLDCGIVGFDPNKGEPVTLPGAR